MKKLLIILMAICMMGLCACGSSGESGNDTAAVSSAEETTEASETSGELTNEDCIGVWKCDDTSYYMQYIELYQGGTGKGSEAYGADEYYNLTWEISDGVINITNTGYPDDLGKVGYTIDDDKMTSVDGETSFTKTEVEPAAAE